MVYQLKRMPSSRVPSVPLPHGLVAPREFEGLDIDRVTIASVLDCHDHRETLGDKANGSTGTEPHSWVGRVVHLTQSGIMSSKGSGKRSQSGRKEREAKIGCGLAEAP